MQKIEEVLSNISSMLKKELTYVSCTYCGKDIYSKSYGWKNQHIPYIEVSQDKILAGYRCPKSEKPIIIFNISLSKKES